MKKLKAFSLLELIVALAIMATVSAIIFYSVKTITRMDKSHKSKLYNIELIHEMLYWMNSDLCVQQNWEYSWGEDKHLLANDSIHYFFNSKNCGRVVGQDSLVINANEVSFTPILFSDSEIITSFELNISTNDTDFPITFEINQLSRYNSTNQFNWD